MFLKRYIIILAAVSASVVVLANPNRQENNDSRQEIIGTWTFIDTVQSFEFPREDAAVERKDFTFNSDGSVLLIEQRRGQSTPMFKEDWLFRSWGTFDIRGDTIMILVNRFQAERINFEKLDRNTGRWVLERMLPYDSLITDGSQNRSISYRDLQAEFRKNR